MTSLPAPRVRAPIPVRRRRVWLALGAGALAAGIAACSGGGVATPSDPVLAKGQTIYNEKCASCHGTNGQGGTGSKLGGGRAKQVFPDINAQIQVVKNGRDGTSMPAWKTTLSDEDIKAVVMYERESLPGA